MEILVKIILIVFLFIIIYVWNRFVPSFLIKSGTSFHKTYNQKNLTKQPVKFVITYEDKIIMLFKSFYWIAFLAFVYLIITNDLSDLGINNSNN